MKSIEEMEQHLMTHFVNLGLDLSQAIKDKNMHTVTSLLSVELVSAVTAFIMGATLTERKNNVISFFKLLQDETLEAIEREGGDK